jgi:hypothetical protein
MALSQKHRIVLYEHFAPQLGEDVTEALLAELPSHDGEELVTKDSLRAELAEQIGAVGKDLGGEISSLSTEMHRLHDQTLRTIIVVASVMTAVLAIFN